MFTGLVEAVGEVTEVKPTTGGSRLRLSTQLAPELANGDSLAVNGARRSRRSLRRVSALTS